MISAAMLLGVVAAGLASDWPQWRGPLRDGISKETGLLKQWPAGGPPLAWKVTGLGTGYGTPSVSGGRIYGMGYRGNLEVVFALDEANGKEVWVTSIASANRRGKGYEQGSRCTPTLEGGMVYALGDSGDLVCLDAKSGRLNWKRDLVTDFGGGVPGWGYTESPLVDGDKLIVTPGGRNAMVALRKTTGEVIWRSSLNNGAGYSSAITATLGGVKQYVQFFAGGVAGIDASSGQMLWGYERPANGTANISTPIVSGSMVFAASAYNTGGGLARIEGSGGSMAAKEVYFTRQMQNHHGGMVLIDGFLYGSDNSTLTCIELATGRVAWANRSVGKGSLTSADGNLILRSEGGPIALIKATSSAYTELGRFDQPDRSRNEAWAHPVVANGKLYIRDMDVLLCYDIKAK